MINNFNENKPALLEEFRSLSSLKSKLDFWENKLGMNYIIFLEDFNNLHDYHEFQIVDGHHKTIDSKLYWEPLNQWILKNFNYNNPKDKNYYLNLETLKKQFNEDLKLVRNKFESVSKEIRIIDESFKLSHTGFNVSPLSSGVMWNFKFNADYKTYTDFITYGLSPDYSSIVPSLQVLRLANGKTLAQYKIYLNSLLKKYPTEAIENNEETQLTSKQIALIIYYTGLLNSDKDITVYAKIFSGLLDINYKNLYDHIRQKFDWKSKENLEAVITFMKNNNIKPSPELLSDLKMVK